MSLLCAKLVVFTSHCPPSHNSFRARVHARARTHTHTHRDFSQITFFYHPFIKKSIHFCPVLISSSPDIQTASDLLENVKQKGAAVGGSSPFSPLSGCKTIWEADGAIVGGGLCSWNTALATPRWFPFSAVSFSQQIILCQLIQGSWDGTPSSSLTSVPGTFSWHLKLKP